MGTVGERAVAPVTEPATPPPPPPPPVVKPAKRKMIIRPAYTPAAKRAGIEGYGLKIVERVSLEIEPNENNLEYLRTKKEKLGHVLNLMS